jgi:hypothetical protein
MDNILDAALDGLFIGAGHGYVWHNDGFKLASEGSDSRKCLDPVETGVIADSSSDAISFL